MTTVVPLMTTTYTPLNLYFRAEHLLDLDALSKSDPYLILYAKSSRAPDVKTEIGRTETIRDSLNPRWLRPISVDFHFEVRQLFYFALYDCDGKGPQGDDFLGDGEFELGHVVGGRGGTLQKAVEHGEGELFITALAVSNVGALDTVRLRFTGEGLATRGWFGPKATYLKLVRELPNGARLDLLITKPVVSCDPLWAPSGPLKCFEMAGRSDSERVVTIECWTTGICQDSLVGSTRVSLAELKQSGMRFLMTSGGGLATTTGTVVVEVVDTTNVPTFVQLLGAGLQVNVAVSIDFTFSNGDPRMPRSLHHNDPLVPNQYVRAISSVCDVVLEYDTDKLIPAFGFGAQLPTGQVSHCFHLNAQPDPNVFGLQGILDAYGATLNSVRLSGPTNFAPSIRQAEIAARNTPNTYTILLILTDGAITDTDATIDAIVACGDGPLSIIIVGVGDADFTLMKLLDGDNERLRNSMGQLARRDLVQFVPFRDFFHAPRDALASEVLREVPRQVEEWAQIHNIALSDFADDHGVAATSEGHAESSPLVLV